MGISDVPVSAADDALVASFKVRDFITHAVEVSKDGLTVSEFGELLFSLVRIAVAAADSFPVDGSEKKKWVLGGVEILFDEVVDLMIPVYAKPFWVLMRPGVRSLVLALASGAIEAILPVLRGTE